MTIKMERAEPEVPKGATKVEVDENLRDIMISRGWVVSTKAEKKVEEPAEKADKAKADEVKAPKAKAEK